MATNKKARVLKTITVESATYYLNQVIEADVEVIKMLVASKAVDDSADAVKAAEAKAAAATSKAASK